MIRLALVLALLAACTTPPPPKDEARALVESANQAKADRKLEEAARDYGKALDRDPTNLVAIRGLVETHHRLGRLRPLKGRFEAAVAASPGDPFAWEGLGLTLFAMGAEHGPAARDALKRAVELAPENADFHYRLGVLLVESDDFDEARKVLAEAVKLEPSSPRYRLPYAVALGRTGDRTEAVKQLAAVLALGPSQDEVALAARTAAQVLDPFRGFPPSAREQFESALTWLDNDSPAQAQPLIDALLEKYPDLAIVHAVSGLAAAKMDDAGRAIASFRKASELAPWLAEPRLYLGELYLARGRADTAKEHLEAAIERNPFLADAYRRLANVAQKLGDAAGAEKALSTYLLLRPTDFEARIERAMALTDQNRPEAGAAWDELAKTFPRRPEVQVGRGRYWFTRSVQDAAPADREAARVKAKESLEAALEIDPENATAAEILSALEQRR